MTRTTPQATGSATGRWARRADRAARFGWWLVAVCLPVAFALGALAALFGGPLTRLGSGVGGLWGAANLGLMLAMLLGVPSLIVALVALAHRRWRGALRAIAYVGPLALAIGYIVLPHALDPCDLGLFSPFERIGQVRLCEQFGPEWNIHTRFHLLWHTAPTLPLAALYRLTLERWHPAWRSIGGSEPGS